MSADSMVKEDYEALHFALCDYNNMKYIGLWSERYNPFVGIPNLAVSIIIDNKSINTFYATGSRPFRNTAKLNKKNGDSSSEDENEQKDNAAKSKAYPENTRSNTINNPIRHDKSGKCVVNTIFFKYVHYSQYIIEDW